MIRFSAEKVSRHLVLAALTVTVFAIVTLMILLLLGESSEGAFPWILLAAAFITVFFNKRIQWKLFSPQVIREYDGKMAYLNGIGGLRGVIFAGVFILAAKITLLFVAPKLLWHPLVWKVIALIAFCAYAAGCFFPVRRAGKRERAWLMIGIIAQFFLFQALDIVTLPPPEPRPVTVKQQVVRTADEP